MLRTRLRRRTCWSSDLANVAIERIPGRIIGCEPPRSLLETFQYLGWAVTGDTKRFPVHEEMLPPLEAA